MKPSEVLSAAKGLIDAPEKWIKGRYHRRGSECDGYCLVGAVECAPLPAWAPTDQALFYIGTTVGVGPKTGLTGWNDAPERTWEEVMAAFDRAIAMAQEAGE